MTFATSHNGGRSQVNLGGIQANGDYPFINMMKGGSAWTCVSSAAGVPPDPDILDLDGYPTVLTSGQGYDTHLFLTRQTDRPGEYILEWDGTGTFLDWTATGITSGSLSSTGTGFCRGTPYNTPEMILRINTMSSTPNHVHNIRFYHSGDATEFAAGEIFGSKLRARLHEANFGVIRFMDWQNNNTTNIAKWADIKPLTHYSYYAGEFRGSAWGANKWYFGVTTNSGNAYSISTTRGRAPINGDVIQLKFNADATQSGTCSLNVDGAGAVNILDSYGGALSIGGNSYPLQWAYGVTGFPNYATLIYNSTIPAWIKQGGDAAIPASGMGNSMPPYLGMILAAEMGAHPWFNAPIHSMDPMTDFVTQLATYCRDNGPSWMIPRFEPPNECFNNAGQFFNNSNCRARGAAHGYTASGVEDYVHEYGRFASTMGQDLNTVYSGNRAKYVFLAGQQTATGSSSTSNGANILTSAQYVAGGSPQSGYSATAAKNYLHGMCVANYYAPSNYRDTQSASEIAMATAYAGGDASQVPAYIALCYNVSPDDGLGGFYLPRSQADIAAWAALAIANGLFVLEFYEGGFSPDYVGGDTNGNNLKLAARNHANLGPVVVSDYNICTGASGSGLVARFPSHYYLSGNKWMHAGVSQSVWALLDDVYETPGSAQWQAIVTYNAVSGTTAPADGRVLFRMGP